MKSSLPITTLSIAFAGIASTYIPLVGQCLRYDRTAIINGEIWRIVTGHLYHYSPTHLWCNVIPLIFIGAIVERQSRPWFAWGCLLSAMAVGTCLFLAHPDMVRFGGLSGLLCGLFAYFGFSGVNAKGLRGTISRIMLAFIFIKTGYELVTLDALLVDWDKQGFVVMPSSHAAGFLTALLFVLIQSLFGSSRMKPDFKGSGPCMNALTDHPIAGPMDNPRSLC
jgi:rhomboid family GlyGly-CTERM serine protease